MCPPFPSPSFTSSCAKLDQAFLWLEKAYDERTNSLAYLKVQATWDPLRSDPRFTDLLRRIGLSP